MANDNGDLDMKVDELDAAIRNHPRPAPPDGLLDRCLASVPCQTTSRVHAPIVAAPPSRPLGQLFRFPWMKFAIAASLLIGTAVIFAPQVQQARDAARKAVPRNNLKQLGLAMNEFAEIQKAEGASPALSKPFTSREPSGSQSPQVDKDNGAVAYAREFLKSDRSRQVPAESSPNSPMDEMAAGRGGMKRESVVPDGTSNSVTLGDLIGGKQTAPSKMAPATSDSANLQSMRGTLVSGRDLPKNLEQLEQSQHGFKGKAVSDASRAEATIALSGKLGEAQQRAKQALKAQKDALEKVNESKLSRESLANLTTALESREKEVERIKEILRRAERDSNTSVAVPNAESYTAVTDNPFLPVSKCPLSTFSTDVDTASYANVRRFLNQGQMPPRDAVRIEELINYFSYDYPQPKAGDPFSVNLEVAGCPWNGEHRLVRIGLKGREIADQQRPPANLVFLVDVSGSMQPANKLPLLKAAMKMLVGRLGENERVAIVTYSHEIRLVLPSTTCDSKETIYQALDSLQAAGSTNGGGGIQMAYSVAVENFIQGGTNRVILATDGDFNVGITDPSELTRFIEQKRESGVFLSVLGFGMGNLKDATLERLADKGNGHYAYIDTIDEARKVLVDQLSGTLVTIAKDVKLQIEFNPRSVSAYRLIGYENRVMPAQDFNDDRKDAGEIGAGHTVTALYEIVPAGKSAGLPGTDPLKYQPEEKPAEERRPDPDDGLRGDFRRELLTVKLRYKKPNEHQSLLAEVPLTDSGRRYGEASSDFKFASAVAAFGMILRDSPHRGTATLDGVLEFGEDGRGQDREGYRNEFLKLVRQAKSLRGQ